MEPQINYSDEFQPTSGKQGSKPEKGSKWLFQIEIKVLGFLEN
jgi:hypothetical protein